MATKKRPKKRESLTEAQQKLAVSYLPMARALAKPFKEQFPDVWEEFESAACLALVEAARAFEPGREVKFPTFARHRIWGSLCDVRRERYHRNRTECSATDIRAIGQLSEALRHDEAPVGAELEAVEAVEGWLRKLPRRHADACRLIYLEGKTHAEVARIMGYSPSRITYMHLESLAILGGTWKGGTRPLPPAPRRRGKPRRAIPA